MVETPCEVKRRKGRTPWTGRSDARTDAELERPPGDAKRAVGVSHAGLGDGIFMHPNCHIPFAVESSVNHKNQCSSVSIRLATHQKGLSVLLRC